MDNQGKNTFFILQYNLIQRENREEREREREIR